MTNSTIRVIQNNIKKYRNKRGLTQDKLSEMASISCDYLSEIERGKKKNTKFKKIYCNCRCT